MRRAEFAITDATEIQLFLDSQKWGSLTMNGDDGYPYSVPLNYLWLENRIYLHSAPSGRKLGLLAADSRVQFSVVKEYAFIPSYFSGSKMACSASQFFKSVVIRGRTCRIESGSEKMTIFQKMMNGFQPEGKYLALASDEESYHKMISGTELITIQAETLSSKFKFGQNLRTEVIQQIIRFLKERGMPLDMETISMIEKYHPDSKLSL